MDRPAISISHVMILISREGGENQDQKVWYQTYCETSRIPELQASLRTDHGQPLMSHSEV